LQRRTEFRETVKGAVLVTLVLTFKVLECTRDVSISKKMLACDFSGDHEDERYEKLDE
jgi:hypothetical protein